MPVPLVGSYLMSKLTNFSISDIIQTRHERPWTAGALILSSAAASYFAHRSLPEDLPTFVRASVGGIVAGPLLMFPCGLPKGSQETLMTSSLCAMMAGRIISGIAEKSPPKQPLPPSPSPSPPPSPPQKTEHNFVSWIGGFFWYVFPVVKSKRDTSPSWGVVLKEAACDIGIGVVKTLFLPLAVRYLAYTTTVGREMALQTAGSGVLGCLRRYLQSCRESFAFGLVFAVGSMALHDYLGAMIKTVTKGKYEHLPFCNLVLLSSSLKELWGRRYNRWVNYWMREVCFEPMRRAGHPAWVGSMCCFGVSGLLHGYASYFTFSKCPVTALRAFTFFLLHGILCTIETPLLTSATDYLTSCLTNDNTDNDDTNNKLTKAAVGKVVGRTWVLGTVFFTLPIYISLFRFPAYGTQNPFPMNARAERLWDYLLPSTASLTFSN